MAPRHEWPIRRFILIVYKALLNKYKYYGVIERPTEHGDRSDKSRIDRNNSFSKRFGC